MNLPAPATHPASETLASFALGRLDDEQAIAVAAHLGVCAACRQAVLAVPDDSMVLLLRPGASTPLPPPELLGGITQSFVEGVPPELRDHARYRVHKRLGAGGMGVVYQAEHRLMERTVALKVIRPQFTASVAAIERFRREVRAVARLSHPNLVQAHDAERAGELHFLVMEFVAGKNLADVVERAGPLAIATACDYARQAALGLAHAEAQGLVHRDVKPHNLMVTAQGQVKVLDFGLASIAAERRGDGGLTRFGDGMGTPDYIAPEQIRDARAVDTRADIYSLGCTLYHLLTGRPPFPEGNVDAKMAAHLEKPPPPPEQLRPELPAALAQVVARMMAKAPAQRYQTPAEVALALAPWCHSAEEPDLPEPTETGPPQARHVGSRRNAILLGACMLVFVLGLTVLGVVLTVRTKNGTIVLKDLPPDAVVLVDGERVSIEVDGKGLVEIHVPAGKRTLEFQRNGFKFASEEVMLAAGGRTPITVRRLPNPQQTSRQPAPLVVAAPPNPGDRAPDLKEVLPLIDDDFKDPDQSHFPTFQDESGAEGHFVDGQYRMRWPHPTGFCRMEPRHAIEGDFACQVVGRPLEQGFGWGMSLGSVKGDYRHHLAIRVRRDGVVDVGTYVRGKSTLAPVVEPIRHAAVRAGDDFNTLLVVVHGQQLSIYVNGTAIRRPIQLEQPLPTPVDQGILAWRHGAKFQRFTVWLLPAPAPPSGSAESNRAPDLSKVLPRIDDHFRAAGESWFHANRNDASGWEAFFDHSGYVLQQFYQRPELWWVHDRYTTAAPEAAIRGDVAIRVVGRIRTKRDNGWAVGLYTPKQERQVGVRLRWEGTVEVGNFFWDREGPVTRVGPIRHKAIHPGDQENTLLVILRGGQRLEIYVNGTAITQPIQFKEPLAPVVSPGIELWERTGHSPYRGRAEFRRFTLWELPPAAPATP